MSACDFSIVLMVAKATFLLQFRRHFTSYKYAYTYVFMYVYALEYLCVTE